MVPAAVFLLSNIRDIRRHKPLGAGTLKLDKQQEQKKHLVACPAAPAWQPTWCASCKQRIGTCASSCPAVRPAHQRRLLQPSRLVKLRSSDCKMRMQKYKLPSVLLACCPAHLPRLSWCAQVAWCTLPGHHQLHACSRSSQTCCRGALSGSSPPVLSSQAPPSRRAENAWIASCAVTCQAGSITQLQPTPTANDNSTVSRRATCTLPALPQPVLHQRCQRASQTSGQMQCSQGRN
jgi:hypothetical protein